MRRIIMSIILLLAPLFALATDFVAGKDYQVIQHAQPEVNKGKIQVIEFFNPGCPWCFHLEAPLAKWLATKPKDVEFKRIPVAFSNSWTLLAKAYYTAESLGVANKIILPLFEAIHQQHQQFNSKADLEKFFVAHGVSKQDFNSAFNFTPGIDAQLNRGSEMLRKFKIMSVPTIVVAEKYKTDTGLTGGNTEKMMQVVKFLINKAAKQKV